MKNQYVLVSAFLLSFSVQAMSQANKTSTVHEGVGKQIRDCTGCPEMVTVPQGTFMMGSPANELGRYGEEGPQRLVRVRSFAVSKYDVTRGEWKAFVADTRRADAKGCDYSLLPKEREADASWDNLGFPQDDSHPVVCISWNDARDYLLWLTDKSGHKYRLLTEAEWEYAARAGSIKAYPWGATASHEYANYGGDDHPGYGVASGRDKWVNTSPVGSFAPNPFGLYDMHGNVMQWVQDCFSNTYTGLPTDGSPYLVSTTITATGWLAFVNGTNSCAYRVLRGGNWGDTPNMIRSASRNFAPSPGQRLETYRSSGLGMRVARNAD